MFRELMYKWFGLEPMPCPVCEILRLQLDRVDNERRELLRRALAPTIPEPPLTPTESEMKPIGVNYIPWRVRQQMLEQEDRKTAQLMRDKQKEINQLEKELGVANER